MVDIETLHEWTDSVTVEDGSLSLHGVPRELQ